MSAKQSFLIITTALCWLFQTADAQVLTEANSAPNAHFELGDLPERDTSENFVGDPFYQGFMILGDGNFVRLREQENLHNPTGRLKAGTLYDFDHEYLDYSNGYPGLLLLIDRKSGDDPPEAEQIVQPGGPGNGMIEIHGAGSPGDKVEIRSVGFQDAPASPMIQPAGTIEKIALGYSHHNNSSDPEKHRYYLKSERIGAFPIAYRPAQSGKLFFFYNSENDTDFEYYDEIEFNSSGDKAGTVLSNYYSGAVVPFDDLVDLMNGISSEDPNVYFSDPGFDAGIFNSVIPYDIPVHEINAKEAGGPDELRLFHLLKNNDLEEGKTYHFLAAMYDYSDFDSEDEANYFNDMPDFAEKITLPERLILGDPEKPLHFVDAAMLSVKHGEPDDPNRLRVVEICRCGEDYQVTFELRFCNKSETPANGANIVLKGLADGGLSLESMFSCYRLHEVSPTGSKECCERKQCSSKHCCFEHELNGFDKKYCLRFGNSSLRAGTPDSCGQILFTAIIDTANLHLLTEKSVMKYCVNFSGGIDGQVICGGNEVVNIEVFYPDPDNITQQTGLAPNPVWESRNLTCSTSCWCEHPFRGLKKRPFFLFKWWRSIFNRCCRE